MLNYHRHCTVQWTLNASIVCGKAEYVSTEKYSDIGILQTRMHFLLAIVSIEDYIMRDWLYLSKYTIGISDIDTS